MLQGLIAAAPLITAGSSLLGGVTSALGASKQLSQRDAMAAQQAFNWDTYSRSLLEGPKLEMRGLRRAGINPLLRYGSHGSPAPVSGFGVSQAPSVNRLAMLGEGIGSSATSAVDALSKTTQAEQAVAQTNKLVSELDQIAATVDNIKADTSLKGVQRDKALEEVQLTAAKTISEWVNQDYIYLQMGLTRAQVEKITHEMDRIDAAALASRMAATVDEIRAELLRLGVPRAELDARVVDTFFSEAGALFRGIFLGDIGKPTKF